MTDAVMACCYLERQVRVGDGAAGALVGAVLLHLGDPLLHLSADLVTLQPHVCLDHLQQPHTSQ